MASTDENPGLLARFYGNREESSTRRRSTSSSRRRILLRWPVWKSNSELGYRMPSNRRRSGGNLTSMAWNLRPIEQMQLRGRRRVDGVQHDGKF